MKVYRLSHWRALELHPHPFIPAGNQARWNSQGVIMAYTSEHLALAALELLNYWNSYPNMNGYLIFTADITESAVETLPGTVDPHDDQQTRPFGDTWVEEQRSLVLKVPSVVLPMSFNYLINPRHPQMSSFTYTNDGDFTFDRRVGSLIELARPRP